MRPVLVYDSDCTFCTRWIERWHARTGERVDYVPYQEHGVLQRFGIPLAAAKRSVQLVLPDGKRYEGAEAVFRLIELAPGLHAVARLGRFPVLRWVARRLYQFVARHRRLASRIDRALLGRRSARRRYGALPRSG